MIIAYFFPPANVVAAVRLFHFYRESRKYFENTFVISSQNRRRIRTDESLQLTDVDIYEYPAFDWRRLILCKKRGNEATFRSSLKKHLLVQLAGRLVESFPLNILIGDGGLFYILSAYRKACQLARQENITHLYSSYRPYADHLAAWLAKRRFPNLFWIADFRDLHVDPMRKTVVFPSFQRWCNRQILKKADLVTTVSAGLKRQLEELSPNVHVLRNGIGNLHESAPPPAEKFDKFTIAYTGTLYSGLSDPSPLLSAIRSLLDSGQIPVAQVALIYAGPAGPTWDVFVQQYGLSSISANCGNLSRAEALEIQRKSHINLLLTWSSKNSQGILTGKLFEYLTAGPPILALVNGPRDSELDEILSACDKGIACSGIPPEQDSQIKTFLLNAFQSWLNPPPSPPQAPADCLKPYTWQVQMEQLMKCLP